MWKKAENLYVVNIWMKMDDTDTCDEKDDVFFIFLNDQMIPLMMTIDAS